MIRCPLTENNIRQTKKELPALPAMSAARNAEQTSDDKQANEPPGKNTLHGIVPHVKTISNNAMSEVF